MQPVASFIWTVASLHLQCRGLLLQPDESLLSGEARLADVVAAQVDEHDVLRALLAIGQQARLRRSIRLGRFAPPPRAGQRPATRRQWFSRKAFNSWLPRCSPSHPATPFATCRFAWRLPVSM